MNDFLDYNLEFVLYPLAFMLYLGFFYFYFTMMKKSWAKKYAIKGFFKIYNETSDVDERLTELKLFFRKLKERYGTQLKNTKNFIEILEEIYFILTTKDSKFLKQRYQIEFDDNIRKTIVTNIMQYKTENPFASLSPKMATHLSNLKNSIDNRSLEISDNVLMQLAEEIELNEKAIEKQGKINRISIFLAVVGVFLTIVFGIKSFF